MRQIDNDKISNILGLISFEVQNCPRLSPLMVSDLMRLYSFKSGSLLMFSLEQCMVCVGSSSGKIQLDESDMVPNVFSW